MSPIEEALNSNLPDDWQVTNLSELGDRDWQVICSDEVHVVIATGDTIEDAILHAAARIFDGVYAGTLFGAAKRDEFEDKKIPLLSLLGLEKPKQTFNRRV